jgi:hypothetical protein
MSLSSPGRNAVHRCQKIVIHNLGGSVNGYKRICVENLYKYKKLLSFMVLIALTLQVKKTAIPAKTGTHPAESAVGGRMDPGFAGMAT